MRATDTRWCMRRFRAEKAELRIQESGVAGASARAGRRICERGAINEPIDLSKVRTIKVSPIGIRTFCNS
jgi:hypothetical protein